MILSWRSATAAAAVVAAAVVLGADFGELLILLLPGDSRIAGGASPKTALDEEPIQIDQRGDIDARRRNPLHANAGGSIEHPLGQHDDHAGRRLDVDDPAAGALLAVLLANPAPIQRMPVVVDLDFLPVMGRMDGRLPLAEKAGCSAVPTAAATAPRRCTA
jgi:hypothetical protein